MRHAVQTARRHPPRVVPEVQIRGEVAERFKAPVLKTGAAAMLPWVRIPPSPPKIYGLGDLVSPSAILAPKCGQSAESDPPQATRHSGISERLDSVPRQAMRPHEVHRASRRITTSCSCLEPWSGNSGASARRYRITFRRSIRLISSGSGSVSRTCPAQVCPPTSRRERYRLSSRVRTLAST
jgi:hypothetical protein